MRDPAAGYGCRLAPGTFCDSTAPDSCGSDMRCIWGAPPNPLNAGFCVIDVARTGCSSSCEYRFGMLGFGGGRVFGYCETATDYCGARCLAASNCRASEICTTPDRLGGAGNKYCLPL